MGEANRDCPEIKKAPGNPDCAQQLVGWRAIGKQYAAGFSSVLVVNMNECCCSFPRPFKLSSLFIINKLSPPNL